jgi:hypothetical protein
MKRDIAALIVSILMLGIGLTTEALACSVIGNSPRLEAAISSNSIVFIGTVMSSGWSEQKKMVIGDPPREVTLPLRGSPAYATLRVEIPIKGVTGDVIEIPQGRGGLCEIQFNTGDRWFFAGSTTGSGYFSGSTILNRSVGPVGVDHEEIKKLFPEVLTLPPPVPR